MKKRSTLLIPFIKTSILLFLSGIFSNAFSQTWTFVDGGGSKGINTPTATYSRIPSTAKFNGLLYSAWQEQNSSVDQVHIKSYNGTSWIAAGESSSSKLNSSSTNARNPKIAYFNGALYAAYEEYDASIYRIHVKKYNGVSWSLVENYSSGDGRTTINIATTANATEVDLIVYNGYLFATWVEVPNSGVYNTRVSRFDGTLWTCVDGGGTYGLNYNTSKLAHTPRFAVYNNQLYLTWTEVGGASSVEQVRVKRYDGGSTWTFVDGNASAGLNYNSVKRALTPVMASYNNYLYLIWSEPYYETYYGYGDIDIIRVRKYDGSTWSFVDGGGTSTCWNLNVLDPANNAECLVYNNLLYVTWNEADDNNFFEQVRCVQYDGSTKTFLDGGGATSTINYSTTEDAKEPILTNYLGNLHVLWQENNSGDQIRVKKALLTPFVESVTVPANGTYISGQTLNFIVTFSKNVNIASGSPYIPITLNTGGTVNATYTGGSGTSALTFSYTVAAGNGDNDGIAVGSAIAGATLQSQDATPLTANLTLNSVGSTTGVLVDASGPTVTNVTSSTANGAYKAGNVIHILVSFSENAIVTSTPTLALNSGGTASYVSGNGTTSLTFDYTIGSNQNISDLDYSSTSSLSGTIKDVSGNDAILTLPTVGGIGSLGYNKDIVIDNTSPTVSISSTANNPTNTSIPITITFSEAVTGFTVGDISVNNGAAGSFTTVNAYTYTASITPTAAGTVTVNINGSVATDYAGNNNSAATAFTVDYDNIPPTVGISSTVSNPTNTTIPIVITFSEAVTGFVVGDITVGNGTAGSFVPANAFTYTATITPSGQGLVTVDIAAGVASDAAGNTNTAATQLGRIFDNVSPTVSSVSSTTANGAYKSGDIIQITVTFSENVSVTGTPTLGLNSGGTASYISGSGSSTLVFNYTVGSSDNSADLDYSSTSSLSLSGGTISDATTNNANLTLPTVGGANSLGGQKNIVIDNVSPTVSLSTTASNPTNSSPIPVTITFSESVTGFVVGDITVTNGIAGSFSGSGTSYTVNITPSGQGTVTIDVGAGVASDAAGNVNSAATPLTRTFDSQSPTVSLSTTASNPTNSSPIPVTITFSESVTGFVVGDITVTNGTAGSFSGSGASYTVNITPSGQGVVTIDVGAGEASDAAGNGNSAATSLTRTFDSQSPTVSLSSTSNDPTNLSLIPVAITFSELVTGFAVEDIIVTNGTANDFSGSGASYTVNIVPSSQGLVTVNIASGVAQDVAGNLNTSATQLSRTFDNVAPTVSVSSSIGDPTNHNSISVSITFSEVMYGFTMSDIELGNCTASNLQTADNKTWTADVSPTGNGAFTVKINAGVAQDLAGNGNLESGYFQRTYDPNSPSVVLSSTSTDPTKDNPIVVKITFSEMVNNFSLSDITVGNGTASNLQTLDYKENWTVEIYPNTDGLVTADIAAGVAQDFAGNNNTAAVQFSRTCDITSPSVVISSTATNPTNVSPIAVNIVFSEVVNGFDISDIAVSNGATSNLQTSDNKTWTVDITPTASGVVTVGVAAGSAQDVLGNNNTVATQFSITYDNTLPQVTSLTTSDVANTSVNANVLCSKDGTLYYVVLLNGSVAPTASEVRAGTGNQGATAIANGNATVLKDVAKIVSITGLTPNTTYTIYAVEVDAFNNTSEVINTSITTTQTGTEILTGVEIKIYPNPVIDDLLIKLSGLKEVVTYSLYSNNGQLLEQNFIRKEETKVNMKNYLPGLYILRISNGSGNHIYKVVKQ